MGSQSHYRGTAKQDANVDYNKGDSKSFTIKPIAMDIIWGGDMLLEPPKKESVNEPAELLPVSRIEVTGWVELNRLEAKTYKLSFTVSMKADAFGWKGSPVYLMAKVGDGKFLWKSTNMGSRPAHTCFKIPDDLKFTVSPKDKERGEKLRFGL